MSRGRPKGSPKTPGSGRKKGTPNKATSAHRKVIEQMKVDTTDALSFFTSVLKNPDAPFEEKKAAARELLPYTAPKLSSIEARAGGTSHEDRLEQLQQMKARAIEHQGVGVKTEAEGEGAMGPQRKRTTPQVWSILGEAASRIQSTRRDVSEGSDRWQNLRMLCSIAT
jgi:hypothetical protein